MPGEPDQPPDPPWEKVLWRRQPFPDNYVPPWYLSELKELREFIYVRWCNS